MNKTKKYFLAAFLLIYLFSLTRDLDKVFLDSTNDSLAGIFAPAAIHWLEFGPAQLRFSQYNFPRVGDYFVALPYTGHPQFIIMPLWLSYKIFGIGEWQTRIVPVIFALAAFVIFWFLIDFVFQRDWLTVISGFFYIFFPANIYFGRMMSHEAIANFFIILALLFLVVLERQQNKWYLAGLLGTIFLGGLIDWPMFYAAAALWLYIAFRHHYPLRRWLLVVVPLVAIFSIGITAAQIILGNGVSGGISLMQKTFLRHSAAAVPSFVSLVVNKIYHENLNFTLMVIVLVLAGLWYFSRRPEFRDKRLFILIMVLPALIHYGLFAGGISHEYWSFYFGSFLALMAGIGLMHIKSRLAQSLIIVYFLITSILHTYFIFYPRTLFAVDDIDLIEEAIIQRDEREFCLFGPRGEPYLSLIFYLMKNRVPADLFPCKDSSYYVLRRWDQAIAAIDWQHYGIFYKEWRQAVKTVGLEAGTVLRIFMKIPGVVERLQENSDEWKPIQENLLLSQEVSRKFARYHHLTALKCSSNFCLYEKQN